MDPSISAPEDEVHALAEVIRQEFGVEGEPLSEKEAERAASIVLDRLHGAGFDVVELYPGEPWTQQSADDFGE